MKTEKENKNRIPIAISIAVIVICVFIRCLTVPFGDLDEIWVYNISRGISMGLIPYKDFHMVFMPLFSFIFALPLLIVRSLIVYRITTAIFFSVLFGFLYKSIKDVSNDLYALPFTLLCMLAIDIATYNHLMMFFSIPAYLLLIKEYSFKRHFIIGILAALSALARQTSGGILLAALFFVLLAVHKRSGDIKRILSYLLGVAVPCFIFLIYLLVSGSFYGFWDDCLFALIGFGKTNSHIDPSSAPLILVIAIGIASDIFFIVKKKAHGSGYHLLITLCMLITAIPIADFLHLTMAAMFCAVPIAKLIKDNAGRYLKPYMSYIAAAFIGVIVVAISFAGLLGTHTSDSYGELKLIPLNGIEEGYYDIAVKNEEYRAMGYNVHVFSDTSAMISILTESFDPPYDLFLNGNLGTRDPVSFPEELCTSSHNIIVIPDDYNEQNKENPDGILEYITAHCTPVDSYGNYIYYIPNV